MEPLFPQFNPFANKGPYGWDKGPLGPIPGFPEPARPLEGPVNDLMGKLLEKFKQRRKKEGNPVTPEEEQQMKDQLEKDKNKGKDKEKGDKKRTAWTEMIADRDKEIFDALRRRENPDFYQMRDFFRKGTYA